MLKPETVRRPYDGIVSDGDVYHIYPILVESPEELQTELSALGIETSRHYPLPLHRQPAYLEEYGNENFPVAEYIASHELSLPIGRHLSLEDVRKIAVSVNECAAK